MADILLYHHVQGLTDGMRIFVGHLEQAGHTVHAPDLFEGQTFETIEDGMDHARSVGFGALAQRGVAVTDDWEGKFVAIGFSFGVMPAQQVAQTHGDVVGAVLIHACLPVSEFGEWPDDVPVQVHGMDGDPFFAGEDLEAARELVDSTDQAELFVYSGDDHLFTDSSLPAYHAEAADQLLQRVLVFLDGIDSLD